jgi:hypothetical protein
MGRLVKHRPEMRKITGMMPMGVCPMCGGSMDEASTRRTKFGVMCMECAFKQSLAETRMRATGVSSGTDAANSPNDSLLLGGVIGLVCGIIGLIAVLILGKGTNMKRGALYGFLIQATLGLFWRLSHFH